MVTVVEQASFLSAVLGKQTIDKSQYYRMINFLIFENVSDGVLAYNTFTREMLLISEKQYDLLNKNIIPYDKSLDYYIEHYFLVPQSFDERILHKQLQNLTIASDQENFINLYSILTTTDCNARCFYCCEHGQKKVTMTDKTASDIADFIIEQSKNHKVEIQWFGGEPLYNKNPIDIISKKLNEANIIFSSRMISNGYLFDMQTIEAALKVWNLKSVQITLDGTHEIYNKTKSYIYKSDIDPFYKVIESIRMLSDNKIKVIIRLNMDFFNKENLYELVDYLHSQFSESPYVKIYIRLLFDNTSELQINRKDEIRENLYKELDKFEEYIDRLGMLNLRTLKSTYSENGCIGTSRHGTIVMPGGELGLCNLKSDQEIYGNIKSGITNPEIIERFKELKPEIELCATCPLYPRCTRLKNCMYYIRDCEEYEKQHLILQWKKMIKNTYEKYKSKHS